MGALLDHTLQSALGLIPKRGVLVKSVGKAQRKVMSFKDANKKISGIPSEAQ